MNRPLIEKVKINHKWQPIEKFQWFWESDVKQAVKEAYDGMSEYIEDNINRINDCESDVFDEAMDKFFKDKFGFELE